MRHALLCLMAIVATPSLGGSTAEGPDDFVGFWKTAQGDGIVQLQRCALFKDAPLSALCGTIVWDQQAENLHRRGPLDCNRKVFEAPRFEAGAWKDGWAFDTRKRRFYQTKLRLKDGLLVARVFVGSEATGETETFTRVLSVPAGCDGRAPEATSVKGVGNS